MKRIRWNGEVRYQLFIALFVLAITAISLLPLIYVLGMSFSSESELLRRNYFILIPTEPTLIAYRFILGSDYLWRGFLVSIFRTIFGTGLTLVVCVMGAYSLAQRDLPGRSLMMLFILVPIVLQAGLIPNYLLINQLGLYNSIWSLVIPALANSFGMLIIKVFIENLPEGLIEAAEIDGASEVHKLFRIVIPLSLPSLAAIGLFTAVNHWNSWFDALIYLRESWKYPVQLIIRNLLLQAEGVDLDTDASSLFTEITPISSRMAAVFIAMIPILLVYPFLQKHFVRGVYMGAVKG